MERWPEKIIKIALDYAFESNRNLTEQRELAHKIASLKPSLYIEKQLNYYRETRRYEIIGRVTRFRLLEEVTRESFDFYSDMASQYLGPKVAKAQDDPRLKGTAYLPTN